MKMRILLCLEMVAMLLSVSCTQMIRPVSEHIRERKLGPIPDGRLHETITRRARHIAWIVLRGPKASVVVDGRDGPEYDEIDMPFFGGGVQWLSCSWDGKRWAYKARRNEW